ncbi:ketosamine-3-kinase-like isoform X2 [Actinia tenebrosa]|uniref:protein-ribulosamine 3-kinase n=1 Tax=Actinia tenebrosa TaxID=6105 RepID=A0A6P8H884_ACTTE|nr:ketosamine-3-kinase-like isoform X1 [Actinia tenebrosa]XP_031551453.1 ketosamine-3-kinase-like isoform X2 [Actinia tenebrosa]
MARVLSNEILEKLLKQELNTKTLEYTGHFGGGCINEGQSFKTDTGVVFVKTNKHTGSRVMFEGELNSLEALMKTNTVRVPRPVKVLDYPEGNGSMLVMEHLDLRGLKNPGFQAALGQQLARLHLHNIEKLNKGDSDAVSKFGFTGATCCGYISLTNEWKDDWMDFYVNQRLENRIQMVLKENQDRELQDFWAKLKTKIPEYFTGLEIKPSLLHGDLWGGNVGEIDSGPVIFDPASFYGHHEFELAIAGMFGGFSTEFYNAYHQLIPKAPGFEERQKLYQLFHYINHWNHFGSSYRPAAISIMKSLTAI